jgi:hypothetical protein
MRYRSILQTRTRKYRATQVSKPSRIAADEVIE